MNIQESQLSDIQALAKDFKLPDEYMMRLGVSLVSDGEIRAFYEYHDIQPSLDDLAGLKEYCEDCQPDTATHGLTIAAWPATVYEHRKYLTDTDFRIRELATIGEKTPQTLRERDEYKRLISDYGDAHGPLMAGWIPVDYAAEIPLTRKRRKLHEISRVRKFARALRGANILPNILEIGPVEIEITD